MVAEFASALTAARAGGVLGGDLRDHVSHASAFVSASPDLAAAREILDLGSGAGIPGLILARLLPRARITLLDASTGRAATLRGAVAELSLGARVSVVAERAELAAHRPGLRGRFDAVASRAFGKPAVTAECAAGFLRLGGVVVVSEPPEGARAERWPADGLARFGLEVVDVGSAAPRFAVLRTVAPLDQRYPRRVGVPGKRPLF